MYGANILLRMSASFFCVFGVVFKSFFFLVEKCVIFWYNSGIVVKKGMSSMLTYRTKWQKVRIIIYIAVIPIFAAFVSYLFCSYGASVIAGINKRYFGMEAEDWIYAKNVGVVLLDMFFLFFIFLGAVAVSTGFVLLWNLWLKGLDEVKNVRITGIVLGICALLVVPVILLLHVLSVWPFF